MRGVEQRAARRLVHAARLHADHAVLDEIDATDAVLAADRVERGEQGDRRHVVTVDGHGRAALEADGDFLRGVGCGFGRMRHHEQVVRRRRCGILQDSAFVRDVPDVAVGRSGMELLNSEKNRREHAIVVNTVRGALENLCSTVQVADKPHLLKLQNIQHLETTIIGELLPGHSILEALHDLHPTPAVGGFPRDAALTEIRDNEQLDRGWYAGPIGWIDKDGHGEFAVALRSGLIDANKATLFAGCGIVADSEPDTEYAESRLKLKVMLRALT